MNRGWIIFILIIAIGAVAGTGYFLYSKGQEAPIVYQTEQPEYRDIIKKTVATGAVNPRKEVEIKPQVSGLVEKLYTEAGKKVKKGDLIAKVAIIPDMVSLNNAENRLNRAKINLKNAKREFDRNKSLLDEGVIPDATYQQFALDYQNAQEEVKAAQDNLDLIRKGSTSRSGNANNTMVRSTIEGMVLDVPVEEGRSVIEANTFNDGTTLATVANMGEMIFEGKVDESEVGKLKTGMDLLLTIGAIDEETFDATLEHISPKGVEENGAIQFEIRASVNLKENQFIRAGYSANADIVLERKDSTLAISEKLLQFDDGQPFVEIETGPQQFERKEVETGLSDGIYIEILSGIDSDTKIKDPNSGENN
ncbi:efflux RND transporter periplasmic adaptor subunit [Pontibacter sp. G13]|uniref:efflux RND transporter periplasmic adaptor subunit n=1 Tax=Pontibacter sp. G13 TaxID=3074898 RepID=UPI00288A037E|nr:efflux RND transporter periplasmic adaptor subunit [Pontibacter sp. G13]WNJ16814.1 efflux RND transporter periplasmic adaptor subunit [Pontibacter sp. G13]